MEKITHQSMPTESYPQKLPSLHGHSILLSTLIQKFTRKPCTCTFLQIIHSQQQETEYKGNACIVGRGGWY